MAAQLLQGRATVPRPGCLSELRLCWLPGDRTCPVNSLHATICPSSAESPAHTRMVKCTLLAGGAADVHGCLQRHRPVLLVTCRAHEQLAVVQALQQQPEGCPKVCSC